MLIYETEGFLEAETNEIRSLCRSKVPISYGDEGDSSFDLHAILCDYQDKSERRCRVAFYVKSLKRALVFTVSGSEKKSPWEHGQETLTQFGFDLENINLKLSPAMLEVVLRDVPGLATPAQARNVRTEHMQLFAELQKSLEDDPESSGGKKAALKLNAEKRLDEKSERLRQLLEEKFSPQANVNEDLDALFSQVKDLTERLEVAESTAEEERSQREMSESITAAAEKRIQELEEILVDVETKSSGEIKLKRKLVALQGQVKTLKVDLDAAQGDLQQEREKHGHFVDDVKGAQENISLLEGKLKENETVMDGLQQQLEEGLAEREQLEQALKKADLRIETLSKELEGVEKKVAQNKESENGVQELETQLTDARQALADAIGVNQQLEADLAASVIKEEYETLLKEHEALKEEHKQDASVRRRLERGAVADEKRIAELEEALAAAGKAGAVDVATSSGGSGDDVVKLNRRIEDLKEIQGELEADLDNAHKMIDSLEQMIREREAGSGGWTTENETDQGGNDHLSVLEEKVRQLELQLEQEQIEQKKIAKTLAGAEKALAGREEELSRLQADNESLKAEKSLTEGAAAVDVTEKKLPHELRPAPQKGAFFHPDWALEGLPCDSSHQVLRVWETVFNVQISLENYPAQYCMAFLVVLRDGKRKKVYLLYRLKMNKHTLVCVPAKQPKDEKELQETIDEGLNFLKMSSFQMEELDSKHIEGALGSYFVPAD